MTLCDPMDCSPPGSSVHGILQARILEYYLSLLQRMFPIHESIPGLQQCRQIFYCLSHQVALVVVNPLANIGDNRRRLEASVGKIAWRREWQPSSILV